MVWLLLSMTDPLPLLSFLPETEMVQLPVPTLLAAQVSSSSSSLSSPPTTSSVPIVQVIQVYGKLAGPSCFGQTMAPPGSSCLITLDELRRHGFFQSARQQEEATGSDSLVVLSRAQFAQRVRALDFAWPLKPYGMDDSSSLEKTVKMNKGVETRVYMQLLEEQGLYNPRNPTGPLPTSLRPQLNAILNQQQQIDDTTITMVYNALLSRQEEQNDAGNASSNKNQSKQQELNLDFLETVFADGMDYYGFLDLLGGTKSISWPY